MVPIQTNVTQYVTLVCKLLIYKLLRTCHPSRCNVICYIVDRAAHCGLHAQARAPAARNTTGRNGAKLRGSIVENALACRGAAGRAARHAERMPVVLRQTPCKLARLRLVRQRDAAAPGRSRSGMQPLRAQAPSCASATKRKCTRSGTTPDPTPGPSLGCRRGTRR